MLQVDQTCKGCQLTGTWFRYGHCVLDDPRILNSDDGVPRYRPFEKPKGAPSIQSHRVIYPSAVSRLPIELLGEIFLFLPDFLQTSEWLDGRPYSSWISILRVCRFWRDVAISYPTLWSYIRTDLPKPRSDMPHVKLLLKRSMQVRLSVVVYSDAPMDILELIRDQLHRIKRLRINIHKNCRFLGLLELSPRIQAPRLEVLDLFSNDKLLNAVKLPRVLSPGARPLRCLAMHGCRPLWDTSTFSKLQILILDQVDVNPREPLNVLSILNLLRNCPNLDMLCIDFTPHKSSMAINHVQQFNTQPIELSFLQRLVLKHITSASCCTFMRHVKFPTRTRWTIHCSDFPWSDPLTIMPHSLMGENAVTELRVHASEDQEYFLEATRFGRLVISEYTTPVDAKCSVAHIASLITPMLWTSITTLTLIVAWPLVPSSRAMGAHWRQEQDERSWRALLTSLPALTNLHFSCGRASPDPTKWNTRVANNQTAHTESNLLLALGPPFPVRQTGKDAYLCQNLHTLYLTAVNFADLEEKWNRSSVDMVWDKLVFVLSSRAKYRIPLVRLVLRDVVGLPKDAEVILKKVVKEVDIKALKVFAPEDTIERRRHGRVGLDRSALNVDTPSSPVPHKAWYISNQ